MQKLEWNVDLTGCWSCLRRYVLCSIFLLNVCIVLIVRVCGLLLDIWFVCLFVKHVSKGSVSLQVQSAERLRCQTAERHDVAFKNQSIRFIGERRATKGYTYRI